MKYLFRVLWLQYFILCTHAQIFTQNLYFNSYTTREGLTQNSVYSITQTKEGFMWFGTQHGLNRFDGKKITQIEFKIDSSLADNDFSQMITAMHTDAQDHFWIGTTEELLIYNRYTNILAKPIDQFPNLAFHEASWVEDIQSDDLDNLWILTRKRLYCYNINEKQMKEISDNNIANHAVAISKSADGKTLFIASENFITVHDKNGFRRWDFNYFNHKNGRRIKNILSFDHTICIVANDNSVWFFDFKEKKSKLRKFEEVFHGENPLIDPIELHRADDHTLWMGSRSQGVLIADLSTRKVNRSSNIYHQNALSKKFVLSLFTDIQHTTWIGLSGGGAAKYDFNNTKFGLWRKEALPGEIEADNMIMSMYTDNDEDFYCGTLIGGLLHTNVKTNKSHYYKLPAKDVSKTEANNIYTIVKGAGNLLWMATWGGLCAFDIKTKHMQLYNDKDLKTRQLGTLLKIKNQNKLIVGGYLMGLRFFDFDKNQWERCPDLNNIMEKYDFRPRYMTQISDSTILVATEEKNVVKYNFVAGVFTFYPELENISNMCPHFYIDKNYWWVGTNHGLIQVDANDQCIIKVWDKSTGLPDNVIYSVLSDETGKVWIGSNAGLTAIDTTTGISKKYNENDGLQSMEFNTASCLKDKNGNLWFGGINGFNKVSVEYQQDLQLTPKPIITSVHILNEPYKSDTVASYLSEIVLEANNNFINFEFQSPSYSQTDNLVYKYRLTPLDTGWIFCGTRNFVNYTQLSPGNYTFEVMAANSNLVWSKEAAFIKVFIHAPWYKTWWFYLVSSILLLSFVFHQYIRRVRQYKKDAEIKHRIAQTEMAALKAQMNPHFIFNCINSIDAYIQTNDKYHASFYLNKFARLIRNILESSKHNVISFHKDLDTIKLYVEMEEMRNDDKFKTVYLIDESIEAFDIKIPPLIVQPYIENAIIHGLRNKSDNEGLLTIKVDKKGDFLFYDITDNGVGRAAAGTISHKKGLSYGMQLSADRVHLFNEDMNSNIEVMDLFDESGKACGTTIKLSLKIS
jgi:ligand-binding sensor domain-containing protein